MAAKTSFLIKIPLYKTAVRVCLTREEWKKYTGEEGGDTAEGWCLSAEGYTPVVGLFNHSPGVIAHEMLHATFAILHSRGMSAGANSEEAFTYLLEYLVEQTHKHLEKINDAKRGKTPDGSSDL